MNVRIVKSMPRWWNNRHLVMRKVDTVHARRGSEQVKWRSPNATVQVQVLPSATKIKEKAVGEIFKMTEGTKSYLIGCHQFLLHPLWVLLAWRLEYKSWPKWWELICIFLHDCGVCGRQYLSDDKAKIGHWEKGADLSFKVVWHLGQHRRSYLAYRSHDLVAGHCPEESGYCESRLSRADKRSWLVVPMWWKWCNYWVEWSGKGIGVTPPPIWTELVKENLKRTKPLGNHELYLKNRKYFQEET